MADGEAKPQVNGEPPSHLQIKIKSQDGVCAPARLCYHALDNSYTPPADEHAGYRRWSERLMSGRTRWSQVMIIAMLLQDHIEFKVKPTTKFEKVCHLPARARLVCSESRAMPLQCHLASQRRTMHGRGSRLWARSLAASQAMC